MSKAKMNMEQFSNVVWCNLEIVILKICSYKEWDAQKVLVYNENPDKLNEIEVVNVFICDENNPIFGNAKSYRESAMLKGIYLGHHFGLPGKLNCIDDYNIAFYHPDPGKIIWCYVIKYVLSIFAYKQHALHFKGGAVEYKKRGFLFLGRGGSGKTEMINALCRNGAKFITNTHMLVKDNYVQGIKSNIRIRRQGKEFYTSIKELHSDNVYGDKALIGGIFWINYNKMGDNVIKKLNSQLAIPYIQYFTEAVINWEMKEDIADYYHSDPFRFAEYINFKNRMIKKVCEENEIYYLNVDIFSNEGFCKTINKMNEIISGKNRKNTLDHQQSGWLSQ